MILDEWSRISKYFSIQCSLLNNLQDSLYNNNAGPRDLPREGNQYGNSNGILVHSSLC